MQLHHRRHCTWLAPALWGLLVLGRESTGFAVEKKGALPASGDTPAMASEKSTVKPAAERSIAGAPVGRAASPRARERAAESAGKSLGPKIPEHLQKALQAVIARRIDRDIVAQRTLRGEAVSLLEIFVKEESPEAREMPEALMRLGELYWETEREQFVARFQSWEKKPTDQRGNVPEPNFDRARAMFARVLKDYKKFEPYDLALYVDGFGDRAGQARRSAGAVQPHPGRISRQPVHPRRAHGPRRSGVQRQVRLCGGPRRIREGDDVSAIGSLRPRVVQERMVPVAPRSQRRGGQGFSGFSGDLGRGGIGFEAQAARRATGRSAEVLGRGVHRRREEQRRRCLQIPSEGGGRRFAGKIVKALAVAFYEQAHYERGIEAYELMLKLDPTGPDAPEYGLAIAEGYATIEDWSKLKATYERLLKTFTLPDPGAVAGGDAGVWARAQTNPEAVKLAQTKIEKRLREDATNLHGKAQRDKRAAPNTKVRRRSTKSTSRNSVRPTARTRSSSAWERSTFIT